LTRPRRRIARSAVAAGERKAASRGELLPEMEKADAHRSIDPWPAKTGGGEQRAHVTPSLDAKFWPCMPVGERAGRERCSISGRSNSPVKYHYFHSFFTDSVKWKADLNDPRFLKSGGL